VAAYVPERGDVVWLEFDPQAGHEHAGHRPALVLTPARYNAQRGMMIACPMTSRIKGYVFEVVASEAPPSVVLADQVKSLDWRARRAVHKGSVSPQVLADVQLKINALLGLENASR
jgi:mRNA interferase MazF